MYTLTVTEHILHDRNPAAFCWSAKFACLKLVSVVHVILVVQVAGCFAAAAPLSNFGPPLDPPEERVFSIEGFQTELPLTNRFAQMAASIAEKTDFSQIGKRSFVPDSTSDRKELAKRLTFRATNSDLEAISRPLRRPDYVRALIGKSNESVETGSDALFAPTQVPFRLRSPRNPASDGSAFTPELATVSDFAATGNILSPSAISRSLRDPAIARMEPTSVSSIELVEDDSALIHQGLKLTPDREEIAKYRHARTGNSNLQTVQRPLRRQDYLSTFLDSSRAPEKAGTEAVPAQETEALTRRSQILPASDGPDLSKILRPLKNPKITRLENRDANASDHLNGASVAVHQGMRLVPDREEMPKSLASGTGASSLQTLPRPLRWSGHSSVLLKKSGESEGLVKSEVTGKSDSLDVLRGLIRPIQYPGMKKAHLDEIYGSVPDASGAHFELEIIARPLKNPDTVQHAKLRLPTTFGFRPVDRPEGTKATSQSLRTKSDSNKSTTTRKRSSNGIVVAALATQKDALELGDLNLIGVYGSEDSRRALVLFPSGKMVKIEIGQRFNGGKVVEIGANSVTYIKNNRDHVLKISK